MNKTLLDFLEEAADYSAAEEYRKIRTIVKKNCYEEFSYAELRNAAKRIAAKLVGEGLGKGDKLIFQINDVKAFLFTFWGCIYAGVIPVPLAVPVKQDKSTEAFTKLIKVYELLGNPSIIVEEKSIAFYHQIFGQGSAMVVAVQEFLSDIDNYPMLEKTGITSEDIAFIQFSSGSTGLPKGVVLKHYNLVENTRQISEHFELGPDSVTCSWMPLTHDMGLIGFHLTPLVSKCCQTIYSSEVFIRYPELFLRYVAEQKVTITGFPNFGIEWILRFVKQEKLMGLDFSHVRGIINGAEPINCESAERFLKLLSNYGLREDAICFAYGMAEACVGVAMSQRKRFETVTLDRQSFMSKGLVKPAEKSDASITLALIGYPLNGIEIIIIDAAENQLKENQIGEIGIKGRNVTEGYFQNDNSCIYTKTGYLKTGDLGFLHNGKLVVTGRKKDIIFKNGANYYSHDLERIVSEIHPELKENVVVVQAKGRENRDKLVLFIKNNPLSDGLEALKQRLDKEMIARLGIIFDDYISVKTFPKTTSGKIQRYLLRHSYENGVFFEKKEVAVAHE